MVILMSSSSVILCTTLPIVPELWSRCVGCWLPAACCWLRNGIPTGVRILLRGSIPRGGISLWRRPPTGRFLLCFLPRHGSRLSDCAVLANAVYTVNSPLKTWMKGPICS